MPSRTVDLSDHGPERRRWLVIAVWTALALLSTLILRAQEGVPLRHAVRTSVTWYAMLGGLVWTACLVDARWQFWRLSLPRAMAARAGVGLVALTGWVAVIVVIERLAIGPAFWRVVFRDWPFQLLSVTMTYLAGVGVGLAVQGFDREREREQRALTLEVLAREAELTALKAQLQPHFLFNALNSVVALVESEPAEAKRMLVRLGGLLHAALDRLDEPLVPLARELEIIRDYLDIERIRFGDRVAFEIAVDDNTAAVLVPPFLLQPLVENAIKHGVGPQTCAGIVRLTAHLVGTRLHVVVADSGAGPTGHAPGGGYGLELTRRRLDTTYGADSASVRTAHEAHGFTVTLDLPAAAHAA